MMYSENVHFGAILCRPNINLKKIVEDLEQFIKMMKYWVDANESRKESALADGRTRTTRCLTHIVL